MSLKKKKKNKLQLPLKNIHQNDEISYVDKTGIFVSFKILILRWVYNIKHACCLKMLNLLYFSQEDLCV